MKSVKSSDITATRRNSLLVVFLFLLTLFLPSIFNILGIEYYVLFQLIIEVFVLIVNIKVYQNIFKTDFKNFKKKWLKLSILAILATIFVIFFNTLINSFIMNKYNVAIPNKMVLYRVHEQTPIYWVASVLLISPIMETLVVPVAFYNLFHKNKLIYLVVSSLLYGLFYVIFSLKDPIQLLYVLSYSFVGVTISWAYYKNNNIYVPLIIKFLYALFTVLIFVL